MRWIFPGRLAAAMAGWFGRFPAQTTVIEDAYLVDPHLPGLSVKERGGRALEIGDKGVPREPGSPGGGRARPRPPGVLAEVVLSLGPARSRQR